MGFFKTPKISVPAASAAAEEPSVKVEEVRNDVVRDYNARTKQRKTLLSTVLSRKEPDDGDSGSGTPQGGTGGLRSTLG